MLFAAIPAAVSLVQNAGGVVHSVEGWLNPGASEDARRKGRVAWLLTQAEAGSVLAARIISAGPDNVSNNEDGFWRDAQSALQVGYADVWSAAVAAGPYWPVGQPFEMPNEVARIKSELAAIGTGVNGGIPSGSGSAVNTAVNNALHDAGQSAVQSVANAAHVQIIPNSTLLLIGVGVLAFFLLRKL